MIPSIRGRRIRRLAILAAVTLAVLGLGAGGSAAVARTGDPIHIDIVGGRDATRPYPSTASLEADFNDDPNFHFCGATVIADQWAVTNAHCVTDPDGTATTMPMHLRVGSPDRTHGGTVVHVTAVLPHASWDWAAGTNPVADIALLHLDTPIHGRHITIPTRLAPPAAPTIIVGWGLTTPDGTTLPTQLQELTTRLLPPARCAAPAFGITTGEICVNNPPNGGACFGDSGSAAMQTATAPHHQLIGAASRGITDTCATAPTIYTNFVVYRSWILHVIRTGQVPPPGPGQEPTPASAPTGAAALRWALPAGWHTTIRH